MSMTYIKQLDSLRAIAVMLVIFSHWFGANHFLNYYTSIFDGVDVFFVLSGFLITGILLKNRREAEENLLPNKAIIKNFFFRRTLRIFPIYYLTILVLYLIGDHTGTSIRENILYFITYTSNFYFYENGWDGVISHFWSLAVEEQFYLVWPWLMLLVPQKHLFKTIVVSIFIGLAGQYMFSDIHTIACFDGFGLGALLAWVTINRPEWMQKAEKPLLLLAILCVGAQWLRVSSGGEIMLLPSRTLTGIVTIYVITLILKHQSTGSLFSKLLANRQMVFVGKISYGIYIYHLILPAFTGKIFSFINGYFSISFFNYDNYSIHSINFALLLMLSYYSYKWIEKPFLNLKTKFEYLPEAATVKEKALVK